MNAHFEWLSLVDILFQVSSEMFDWELRVVSRLVKRSAQWQILSTPDPENVHTVYLSALFCLLNSKNSIFYLENRWMGLKGTHSRSRCNLHNDHVGCYKNAVVNGAKVISEGILIA